MTLKCALWFGLSGHHASTRNHSSQQLGSLKGYPNGAVRGRYSDGRMTIVPKAEDLRQASDALRRIIELTAGLGDDSQADAAFRERLKRAAEVLSATAKPNSR